MVADYSNMIAASKFNYKIMKDGRIKVLKKSIDSYRKLAIRVTKSSILHLSN